MQDARCACVSGGSTDALLLMLVGAVKKSAKTMAAAASAGESRDGSCFRSSPMVHACMLKGVAGYAGHRGTAGRAIAPCCPLGRSFSLHSFKPRPVVPLTPAEPPPGQRRPTELAASAGRRRRQRMWRPQRCPGALRHSQPCCRQSHREPPARLLMELIRRVGGSAGEGACLLCN